MGIDTVSEFAYNIDIPKKEAVNMPNIRPSSELRNNYNEISAFCHKYNEPVYITKNGTGDLAVMSIEAYERLTGRFELYSLLEEGLRDAEAGRVFDADEVMDSILEDLRNGTI